MTNKKTITAGAILAYLLLAYFLVQYLAGILYFLANKTIHNTGDGIVFQLLRCY